MEKIRIDRHRTERKKRVEKRKKGKHARKCRYDPIEKIDNDQDGK